MVTYIIWSRDQKVEITLTRPASWDIEEVFNPAQRQEIQDNAVVFSGFPNNGYLGLIIRIPVLEETQKSEAIVFSVDDGSGLAEVHEREVIVSREPIAASVCYTGLPVSSWQQEKMMAPARTDPGIVNVHGMDGSPLHSRKLAEKEIISRAIKEIFMRTDAIDADLSSEFRIEGKLLTFLCRDKRLKYDLVLAPGKSRPLPKTIKYTHIVPFRVAITRLSDLARIPSAVVYTDDGYKIRLGQLNAGERYLLSLEHTIEDCAFLNYLVEKAWYSRTVYPDVATHGYDVIALLKYPDIVKRDACGVEIRDIEIFIDMPAVGYFSERDINKTYGITDYYSRQLFAQGIGMVQDLSNQRTKIRFIRAAQVLSSADDHARIRLFLDLSDNTPAANGIFFC